MKNQMRKSILYLCVVTFAILMLSCVSDEETTTMGNWVRRSYFEGSNRANAATFTIGDRAFVVGGYTGSEYLNDLWEYDASGDFWIRKGNFPGTPRSNAVAFSIDGKGYIGTGYDGRNRLADFWQYDPETDTWSEVASFGGTGRYNAIGFSLSGKGYVGTGFDGSDQKDFWQYDPTTDSWSQIVSMGGAKRSNAMVFVINNTAYIGTGINNGAYETDFWALNGSSLNWTKLRNLTYDDDYNLLRTEAASFSLGGLGYIATGNNGSNLGSLWEYHPDSDTWTEKTSFEGVYRTGASSFVVSGRGYVLLGRNASLRFDDIYEFEPFVYYNDED